MPGAPERKPTPRSAARLPGLDGLRGLAIVWMVAFHACFDLNWLGFVHLDLLGSPWWYGQRLAIVSIFLLCSGVGQSLAMDRGRSAARFWRRWLQIAGCALLVSIGSWLLFPASFIYFGILQAVAAMLLLHKWVTNRLGLCLLPLALLALAAPWIWRSPLFDPPLLNWTGLVVHKPVTEDYVPLLPWLGVFWLGTALGSWFARQPPRALRASWSAPALSWLGRRPLTLYMVHQPLLLALLWPLAHALHRL